MRGFIEGAVCTLLLCAVLFLAFQLGRLDMLLELTSRALK